MVFDMVGSLLLIQKSKKQGKDKSRKEKTKRKGGEEMKLTNEEVREFVEFKIRGLGHAVKKIVSASTGSDATGDIYAALTSMPKGKKLTSSGCNPAYNSFIYLICPDRKRGIPAYKLFKDFRKGKDCTGITKITADGDKVTVTITKELSVSKEELGLE